MSCFKVTLSLYKVWLLEQQQRVWWLSVLGLVAFYCISFSLGCELSWWWSWDSLFTGVGVACSITFLSRSNLIMNFVLRRFMMSCCVGFAFIGSSERCSEWPISWKFMQWLVRKGLIAKLVWILELHKTWLHIAAQHFDNSVHELLQREQQKQDLDFFYIPRKG